MRLGDYLVPTTVDWPGKCAMIVWFAGCDFRCPFCQNGGIVPIDSGREENTTTLKRAIMENIAWIDGVVFSGGEPTLQRDALLELSEFTKGKGRGVMIDTNGSLPGVIEDILSRKVADRISLDLKGDPERYGEVSGVQGSAEKVLASLETCLSSEAELEVRTTVVPGLIGPKDVEAISKLIPGCDVYYLQQFRPEGDLLDASLSSVVPPTPRDLTRLGRIAKKRVDRVGIKTREFGIQYL